MGLCRSPSNFPSFRNACTPPSITLGYIHLVDKSSLTICPTSVIIRSGVFSVIFWYFCILWLFSSEKDIHIAVEFSQLCSKVLILRSLVSHETLTDLTGFVTRRPQTNWHFMRNPKKERNRRKKKKKQIACPAGSGIKTWQL